MTVNEFVDNAKNHCDFYQGYTGDAGMLRDKLFQAVQIIECFRDVLKAQSIPACDAEEGPYCERGPCLQCMIDRANEALNIEV